MKTKEQLVEEKLREAERQILRERFLRPRSTKKTFRQFAAEIRTKVLQSRNPKSEGRQ